MGQLWWSNGGRDGFAVVRSFNFVFFQCLHIRFTNPIGLTKAEVSVGTNVDARVNENATIVLVYIV